MKLILKISRRSLLKITMASMLIKYSKVLGSSSLQKNYENKVKFEHDDKANFSVTKSGNINEKYIKPEQFYRESDGDDFTNCINKAIETAVKSNKAVYLAEKYRISNTLKLLDNSTIIGKHGSELFCDENIPITLIEAKGRSNIRIYGVNFNGNVTGVIKKNYTRVVRFIDCKGVYLNKVASGNNADWCMSFEGCTDIFVTDVNIYGGGRKLPGGRDGIHFLDCSNFTVKRAYIVSGDDCIGITTKYKGSYNGYISDIIGSSEIGSIVIYNEELLANKQYSANKLDKLTIKNVSVIKGDNPKDVVRIIAYNKFSDIQNVTLDGISGSSLNHGVFIGGVHNLKIKNINVLSVKQHGVYIINSSNVESESVTGHSEMKNFYGVSIVKSHNVFGSFKSFKNNIHSDVNLQDNKEIKITK